MANINIQRRSSSAVWWIIALIAVLLLLWFAFGWGMGDVDTVGVRHSDTPVAATPGAAIRFG